MVKAPIAALVALKLSLGSAAPDLRLWTAQAARLPEGAPDRTALELAVAASSLAPADAARMLSIQPLTRPELVAVSQIAARAWAADELAQTARFDDGRSPRGTAPALQDLREALVKWGKRPERVDVAARAWARAIPQEVKAKPYRRGALLRLGVHVYDVDDNLFLKLPTKIILFHKATGEELVLSTEEYAQIRPDVGMEKVVALSGRSVNLADYERRHDTFREFRDPPGVNNFLPAVKWVVENLPEKEWQGPMFKSLQRMLSDPDTARHAAILTARKHRPESYREAFEYLREKGYVEHLPPLEHMFGVGDAVNADTAGAKVEIMKPLLDRVQATPVGLRAKKVFDQDGRSKKRLHVVHFSDDDRGNFERMASGLAAELRADPKRWSKIKIVLHYTGKGKRHVMVLTSHGGRRGQMATERAEK